MDYKNQKNQFAVYFFMATTVISFAVGLFLGKKNQVLGTIDKSFEHTAVTSQEKEYLNEIWELVNKDYVGKIPSQDEVLDSLSKGLVDSLDDPHTIYFSKEESEEFMKDMEGSFEGIGAEVGFRDKIVTIIAPLEGMPAQKAGLEAGDKILEINDESTADMSLNKAVSKIRGPKGTAVKLTIFRENNGDEPMEIEVTRDTIDIKSVKWELKDGNIAYIRLNSFLEDTSEEFNKAVDEVKKSKAEKIVLDLRNNPGGYLGSSLNIAGHFLKKGSLVVVEDYAQKNDYKDRKDFSSGKGELKDYPIVILVNQGTASAAEILAGAIRDNRGAKLIGRQTFGKGSVQEVEKLDDGASIKITVAKWLTPNGKDIDEEGLTPDIEVEEAKEKEQEQEQKDKQLEKALEEIKNQ
ncbi:MAG: PDZ domain-containing protein [Candidatus Moranbacteria bacterium]|nr:PDZ domain-containing protein [Candidatus Moranbacteria bacterium]